MNEWMLWDAGVRILLKEERQGRRKKDPWENRYQPFQYTWFTMHINTCNACHLTNLTEMLTGVTHTQRKTHSELNRMIQVERNMQGHLLIKTYFVAAVVQKPHSPDSADPECKHSNSSWLFSLQPGTGAISPAPLIPRLPSSWKMFLALWLPGRCGTL